MNSKATYGIFISIVLYVCFGFSSSTQYTFNKSAQRNDTIIIDSLRIDTLGNMYKLYKDSVHASYYHDKFNGRRTASGAIFSNNDYTAAHKTLAFGTKVLVTNLVNGKSALVTITDRGPFIKGREIDLSRKVFMEIAQNKQRGVLDVTLEILQEIE